MVQGMCARSVHTRDGKRQITAVHIPGDFVDLHGFLLKEMDHDVMALENVEVAFIPHLYLTPVTQQFPPTSLACCGCSLSSTLRSTEPG